MSKSKLQMYFNNEGVKCDIIGVTPSMMQERGVDILVWLHNTILDIEKFVIIDDVNNMTGLEEYLVLIDPLTGLTDSYREQVENILKTEEPQ